MRVHFDEIDGVIVQAEARFYPRKKGLKGFYLGSNLWIDSVTNDDHDARVELAVIAGWQWFSGKDFGIGFGLGAAVDLTDGFEFYDGHRSVVRFNIGYAF